MAASKKSSAAQSRRSKGSATRKSTAKKTSTRKNTKKSSSAARSKRSTAAKNTSVKNRRNQQADIEETQQELERREEFRREIFLWGQIAIALLLFVSNLGFGGTVGGAISSILFGVFGFMAYLVPVLFLAGSLFYYANRGNSLATRILIAVFLLALLMCMLFSLIAHGADTFTPIDDFFTPCSTSLQAAFWEDA